MLNTVNSVMLRLQLLFLTSTEFILSEPTPEP